VCVCVCFFSLNIFNFKIIQELISKIFNKKMNNNNVDCENLSKINSAKRLKEFDDFYHNQLKPRLFKNYLAEPTCIRKLIERFDYMIDYNVPHGKKLRGLCAYESLILLVDLNMDKEEFSQSDKILIEQSLAVGWSIEFVTNVLSKLI
jgi:hypothetical protein